MKIANSMVFVRLLILCLGYLNKSGTITKMSVSRFKKVLRELGFSSKTGIPHHESSKLEGALKARFYVWQKDDIFDGGEPQTDHALVSVMNEEQIMEKLQKLTTTLALQLSPEGLKQATIYASDVRLMSLIPRGKFLAAYKNTLS